MANITSEIVNGLSEEWLRTEWVREYFIASYMNKGLKERDVLLAIPVGTKT